MPGPKGPHDTDRIVIDLGGGGGGGGINPASRGGGGGDEDSDRRRWKPPQGRYPTAITLTLVSISMFFLVPCTVFIVLAHTSKVWVPLRVPRLLWLNTAILLVCASTIERARQRLSAPDFAGFRKLWRVATILGMLFLVGQFIVWVQLAAAGLYIASNQAASFLYVFTAVYAVELPGRI